MYIKRMIDLGEEGSIDVEFFSTKKELANDGIVDLDYGDEQEDYIDVLDFEYCDMMYSEEENEIIREYIKKNKHSICTELSKAETEIYREWGVYDLGGNDKQKW